MARTRGAAASIEREAWDGDWYKRGWFDDGAPLGSATNEECRIDSIAQSWAVISGVARAGTRRPRYGGGRAGADPARGRPGAAVHAAVRQLAARSRLHQGLSAGLSRERRAIHPCRPLVGDGLRRARRRRQGGRAVLLLNPINHARTRTDVHRYKVEPYVVAADVYAAPGHVGRGGWTWYTGSAAWMQRAGLESILGLRMEARSCSRPLHSQGLAEFEIMRPATSSRYEIVVDNPDGVSRGVRAELDGAEITERPLRLRTVDDGAVHRVRVTFG